MDNSLILVAGEQLATSLPVKNILEEAGYNIVISTAAFEIIVSLIDDLQPLLILLNVNQDDDFGINLGHHLLQKDTIPYIYISSCTSKSIIYKVKETRPYGIIVNPFRVEDITIAVALVIHNFLHKNIDNRREMRIIDPIIPYLLKNAVDYINQNISEKITISELAKATKWNSQHFSRLFIRYIGVTPKKYITNIKIEKAKVLLTETKMPITDISFELGIKSHSNFCSVFKKAMGMSPENFRKSNYIFIQKSN